MMVDLRRLPAEGSIVSYVPSSFVGRPFFSKKVEKCYGSFKSS
ncbi:hypothetical protein PHOSAC3_150301 [Mesotoga infera]|nr:hypothetical protein PHOSAC3_150301 [Mesotoga infera]